MAIAGGALWLVLNFGQQGPSLFCNWNDKLAIFDIKRGCIGMKRGTIGPWANPEGMVLYF